MKKAQGKNRKRLHLAALVLGAYAVFLGFGLILAGIEDLQGVVGPIRLLLGLGMMGFGLFGVWDGIRDKIRPQEKLPLKSPTQYILMDNSGSRTSNVTAERIHEELEKLRVGERDSFHLQLLTPLEVPERGELRQVTCVLQPGLTLLAFFQMADGAWTICGRDIEPEGAAVWFRNLLEGAPEFSGWETMEEGSKSDQTDGEETERPLRILQNWQEGRTAWHRRLTIAGEAWRNEYRFFTARDVELAAQGVFEGKYQYAILEWGASSFDLLPDQENQLQVIWCTNIWEEQTRRYFRKTGTVNQVKFWLMQYLNEGKMNEYWDDITALAGGKGRK